ncbi:MAG TPA: WG repeat-containing protein, partial [Clostridia bacterium]|nr:WG repeat-containing protein [Clostridia bacterium]
MKGNIHRQLKNIKKTLPENEDFKQKLYGELSSFEDLPLKSKDKRVYSRGIRLAAIGVSCFILVIGLILINNRYKVSGDNNFIEPPLVDQGKPDISNSPIVREHDPSEDQVLLLVCADNKFGFMDMTGKTVIEPQFDLAWNFNEFGVAMVMNYEDGQEFYGLLGVDGLLTDVNLWDIGEFYDGIAKVKNKDGKYGFIDYKGDWIAQPIYDEVKDFSEGLAAVGLISDTSSANPPVDTWGFIDARGKEIIEPMYGRAENFSNGLAYVQEQGSWKTAPSHYIDKSGQTIITLPQEWQWIISASEFADDGTAVISSIGEDDRSISLDGLIDRQGRLILPFEYEYIADAVDGLRIAAPKKESDGFTKGGIMDMDGNWVVQPEYFEMGPIKDGLVAASVIKDGRQYTGILRVDGSWLYEPINSGVYYFQDDMVVFIEDTGYNGVGVVMSLYDLKGNQLLNGEKYNEIRILSHEFINCGTDIDTGKGIKKWMLMSPDGEEIMEGENILDAYRLEDRNIMATVLKEDGLYTGLLNSQGDKWIIEPRYAEIIRYDKGVGGGIR